MSNSNFSPIFVVGLSGNGVDIVSEAVSQHSSVNSLTGLSKFSTEHDQQLKRMAENAGSSQHQLFTESYGIADSILFSAERFDFDASNRGFIDWLVASNYRVIHIVSDNILNYLAHQMARNGVKEMEADYAISIVEQLGDIQSEMRLHLNAGNCLEVKREQLQRRSGELSTFAVQQICNFARIDAAEMQLFLAETADSKSLQLESDRIKRGLRPEMTRRGWSNLFALPKAA